MQYIIPTAALLLSMATLVYMGFVMFSCIKEIHTEISNLIKSKGIRVSLQERSLNLSQSEATNISGKD